MSTYLDQAGLKKVLTDLDGKLNDEVGLTKGQGNNSIVMAEGDATGDYALAGGTANKDVIKGILGNLASTAVTVNTPSASADCSMSFGSSTEVLSTGGNAIGVLNTSGVKGYYWKTIDFSTNTITLVTNRNPSVGSLLSALADTATLQANVDAASVTSCDWAVDDYISLVNDAKYPYCAKITAVGTASVSYTGYVKGGIVPDSKTVTSTTVSITVDALPFTEIKSVTVSTPDDYSIYACYQKEVISNVNSRWYPRTGVVELGWAATTFGVENLGTGSGSFATGWNNWQAGDFGFVTGRDNIGGYSSLTSGMGNRNIGRSSLASGNSNRTDSTNSAVLGKNNVIAVSCNESTIGGGINNQIGGDDGSGTVYTGTNNFIAGNTNKIFSNDSAVFGQENTTYSANSFVAGYLNTLYSASGETAIFGKQNTVGDAEGTASVENLVGGFTNTVKGNFNTVAGTTNTVTGSSHAVFGGTNTIHGGAYGLVGGTRQTVAAGVQGPLMGGYSCTINANNALCFGNTNIVDVGGTHSLVGGANNITSGARSAVFGQDNVNTGAKTIICGNSNNVEAEDSAVFGQANTVTNGAQQFVTGNTNQGTAGETLVSGKYNSVNHWASLVGGINNRSSRNAQTVLGCYAADDSDALLIVGNGGKTDSNLTWGTTTTTSEDGTESITDNYSDTGRKNAFVVYADGRAKVGLGPSDDLDVATKQYVDTALTNIQSDVSITGDLTVDGSLAFSGSLEFSDIVAVTFNTDPDTNTISTTNSIAVGVGHTISGARCSAFGTSNKATSGANDAVVFGQENTVSHAQSAVFGRGNTSSRAEQLICGYYSNPTSNDYFAVGNGSASSKHNAFSVTAAGKAISGSSTTSSDTDLTLTTKDYVDSLVEIIYPIGSIYMAVNEVDPSTLFSGTTWERIKDKFLLAAGDTYALGATGGAATHTLTADEIPSHSHTVGEYTEDGSTARYACKTEGIISVNSESGGSYNVVAVDTSAALGTSYVGGGQAHNNMPPYLAVYMWKRTA